MAQTVSIFGVSELDAFFRSLSRSSQYNLIMNAYSIASKPFINKLKQSLRDKIKRKNKTGNLYKSIGFVRGNSSRAKVFVSAKIGARKFRPYAGFHGHLVDEGTVSRRTKKGYSRGTMPASHFFTNTMEKSSIELSDNIKDAMLKALEKFIEKEQKKFYANPAKYKFKIF